MHNSVTELEKAKNRLLACFDYLYEHGGLGRLEVDIKILQRGQLEALIRCGRGYRFVLDAPSNNNQENKKQ